ncbi:hypothetical protein M413DRAFT_449933 [Hebeloma cylindrosporum]|uniref:Uncharacterized protein n=1 Tax=Hebeloma cylindrosporum TaxID=76867 RepID=A0A0C3BUG3_HEBCY|nr:hypothetical protein M413DRAFT_449933 [Hebeloma cylindrosporum h7]
MTVFSKVPPHSQGMCMTTHGLAKVPAAALHIRFMQNAKPITSNMDWFRESRILSPSLTGAVQRTFVTYFGPMTSGLR